jgi:hypothetical protein
MKRLQIIPRSIAIGTAAVLAAGVLLSVPARAAEAPKPKYPSMAPLDQYLITDRKTEIALARTAAPDAISRDATILVLGKHGYETAVEGKNGFVCMVERGWSAVLDYGDMWNPKNRSPLCLNPPAVRSMLPIAQKKTEMVLAGKPIAEIHEAFKVAYAKHKLPPLEPGAMSYMMSKEAYLNDSGSHNMCHLMFYMPFPDGKNWGADEPKSPAFSSSFWFPDERGTPSSEGLPPIQLFYVSVPRWSDGTAVKSN